MKAKNPILLLAALLTGCLSLHAATYYVSSISGNDSYTPAQAQNSATPWRTIAKVNSYFNSLNPGDQILLQAGSLFLDPLRITKSGTASQLITISTYGSGAAPMIDGFASLSGWVATGGNIWQTACTGCGLNVNMVDISDSSQYMGRFPNVGTANGGYLQVGSYSGTGSITDPHLTGSWSGANVVIRKARWIIENDPISSQAGATINYVTSSTYTPTVKYGYFIQNSLKTLDKNGEWYYDPVAKKMNLYSTASPTTFSVQASRIDTLAYVNNASYIKINGIYFQGANKVGLALYNAGYITVTNCTFRFNGYDAVNAIYTNYLNLDYCTIDYTNNDAVNIVGNENMVQDCTIKRTGTIAGMGDALNSYMAVSINGSYNTVQHNSITNTGYSVVTFVGSNNTIQDNYIDTFCFVKDDGGGIYTWNGNLNPNTLHNTGWVTSNIVLNGITCPAGTDSDVSLAIAHGIYLDENTTECYVTGNTVTKCTGGVFFQDVQACNIQNNTFYDNVVGQIIWRHALATGYFKGNDVSNNVAVCNAATENNVVPSSISPISTMTSMVYVHNNKYGQVLPGTVFYHVSFSDNNSTGSWGNWQGTLGMDQGYSTNSAINYSPYVINNLIGSDLYTKGVISAPFAAALLNSRVVATTPVGALLGKTWYVANFTSIAPDNTRSLLVFMQQNLTPFPQLTPVITVPIFNHSTNNMVAFQTNAATGVGALVFQIQNTAPGVSVSNITLYQANVSMVDPDNNVIFQYNASKSSTSINLSGTYQDAGGTTYSGSVTIPAYGSVLLFKKL